ncbi:MAG: hypothetical protein M1830_000807 [Pleopsidium flavum]|nr:MAG: hypothetical protein M1830_000807 [Pleopsidium flavum]
MLFTTLLLCAGFVDLSIAGYVIEDDYTPSTLFNMFDFFTGHDPTNGYVSYVDQATAQSTGLINTNNGAAYIGVDYTNVASGSGRASVRLTSKKSYNHGLVIADIAHMPGGICGTWPAFWMVGPDWPNSGEIDIFEGVNQQSQNDVTLHTNAGCSITNNGAFTGTLTTPNCDGNAPGQPNNAGCQIADSATNSYGAGFNANGGGVYATEWTSSAISVYFFPRGSIPSDIGSGNPNPAGWGKPLAQFQGGCDIDAHFQNQQIVFDTTFCGDWAGNVWSSSSCASKAPTCSAFVQNNPSAFKDAYWSVNSVKVYQSNGASSANVSVVLGSSSAAVSVSSAVVSTSSSSSAIVPSVTSLQAPPTTSTAPTATVMVTSAKPAPQTQTVSALGWGQFPSSGETQTLGLKPRSAKSRHERHLLQHRKRQGGGAAAAAAGMV